MNAIHKKILLALIILAVIGALVFIMGWISTKQPIQQTSTQNQPAPSVAPAASSIPSVPVAGIVGTKIYHNEEFGFEFQYPGNWSFEINSFYSPFSKFNLQGNTSDKKYNPFNPTFMINIVTPDFIERQFFDLKNTASRISVGGVEGEKYEYHDEFSEVSVILPFGQYKMILGTEKSYAGVFNQILASFKFLKQ